MERAAQVGTVYFTNWLYWLINLTWAALALYLQISDAWLYFFQVKQKFYSVKWEFVHLFFSTRYGREHVEGKAVYESFIYLFLKAKKKQTLSWIIYILEAVCHIPMKRPIQSFTPKLPCIANVGLILVIKTNIKLFITATSTITSWCHYGHVDHPFSFMSTSAVIYKKQNISVIYTVLLILKIVEE